MSQHSLTKLTEPITPIDLDQLETRLQGKLSGRIRNLQLHFLEHGFILRGFARTYHAKQVAQHALMTETALPILANEIVVC